MEKRNRHGCLIAMLILAAFACCIVVAAAVALGLLTDWSYDIDWQRPGEFFRNIDWQRTWEGGRLSETEEETFRNLGDEPRLVVDNFAGTVTILAGDRDAIEVVATRRANTQARLDGIEVDWSSAETGVEITTRRGQPLGGNMSVDLEIVAPPGIQIELRLGAGVVRIEDIQGGISVEAGTADIDVKGAGGPVSLSAGTGDVRVEDVNGEVTVHTGIGDIDVRGAVGRVELHSGTGQIDYQGRPEDASSFDAGIGDITLKLPHDADLRIELKAALGDVTVRGFDNLEESGHAATGVLGDGSLGSIRAYSATGNVTLDED